MDAPDLTEIDMPELLKLAAFDSFPPEAPRTDDMWGQLAADLSDWGYPGWLDNYSHREIVKRGKANQKSGETGHTIDTSIHVPDVAIEDRRHDTQNTKIVRVHEASDDSDSSEEELDKDSEGEGGGHASARKTKKEQKPFAELMLNAAEQPAPLTPEERFTLAFTTFHDGLDKLQQDPTKLSKDAYMDPVPDLEDSAPPNRPPIQLMGYQREALGQWRESCRKNNCFLYSDAMGLGKTLVGVAKIKLDVVEAHRAGQRAHFLVVVPVTLLSVWAFELARCPSIKVIEYHHGQSRMLSRAELVEYDVILTTYGVVKSQFRKLWDTHLAFRAMQDGVFDIPGARDDYLQNNSEQLTNKRKRRGTTVKSEGPHTRVAVPLFGIKYKDIILDEAHHIKNKRAIISMALLLLEAENRVCITGTPLQNSYWDLFSLLRFMKLEPWTNERFFRECFIQKDPHENHRIQRMNVDKEYVLCAILNAIQLRRGKQDIFEGRPLTGVQEESLTIVHIRLCKEAQERQEVTRELWHSVTRQEKLRETKRELSLRRQAPMTAAEMERLHELDVEKSKAIFQRIYKARANVIHLRLLEAQYSEHGAGDLEGHQEYADFVLANFDAGRFGTERPAGNPETHNENISSDNWTQRKKGQFEANRRAFREMILSTKREWISDKIWPIVKTIRDILYRVHRDCQGMATEAERKEHRARNKIIVFGDFLAALDLVEMGIEQVIGIGKTVHFNGSCSRALKRKIQSRFEEEGKDFSDPPTKPDPAVIMLATSKTASEGLTLVHARHVLFVGPQWNPYVEQQAIARAARIGQHGKVQVYHFIAQRSIEERIWDLGQDKILQASGLENMGALRRSHRRLKKWGFAHFQNVLTQGVIVSEA